MLGYDPYWTDTSKRRFEWRHFGEIRKAGFDFVRVILQAFKHMDAQNRLDPAWLDKLDDVVRDAQKAGLGVILDEHDFDRLLERCDAVPRPSCRPSGSRSRRATTMHRAASPSSSSTSRTTV